MLVINPVSWANVKLQLTHPRLQNAIDPHVPTHQALNSGLYSGAPAYVLQAIEPRDEQKEWIANDQELMKAQVRETLQLILESEKTEQIGAAPGERSLDRSNGVIGGSMAVSDLRPPATQC